MSAFSKQRPRSFSLHAPQPELTTEAGMCLTRLMSLVYSSRTDLIRTFPLNTPMERTVYLIWFYDHGTQEYDVPVEMLKDIDWQLLAQNHPAYADEQFPITILTFARRKVHQSLHKQFDIDLKEDRAALSLACRLLFGIEHAHMSPTLREFALAPSKTIPQLTARKVNNLLHTLWRIREDIQKRFPLTEKNEQELFLDWISESGAAEFELMPEEVPELKIDSSAFAHSKQRSGKVGSKPFVKIDCSDPGVNVIGAVTGDYGLGEHARGAALGAEMAEIPCCAINVAFEDDTHNYTDESVFHLIRDEPFYRANVIVASLDWCLKIFANPHKYADNYNIYYGAWEMDGLPKHFAELMNNWYFDEAWAQSKFQVECLQKYLDMPVIHMPLSVRAPSPGTCKRSHFGLPESKFLFLYVFDGASFIARKNPMATIAAFQKAFPAKRKDVGLVLKTKNLSATGEHEAVKLLRETVAADPRIIWLEANITRAELEGLLSLCDCYVSLHRAEGFGLTIAETMLLGKPTIVTNYSGNTDFCHSDNSCLVDYTLVPVNPGEYPMSEGQKWANPDVEHAAAYMQKLVSDPYYARQVGQAAAAYIAEQHSISALGRRMKERIAELDRN